MSKHPSPFLIFLPTGLGDDLMVFWAATAGVLAGILPKGLSLYFQHPETHAFTKKISSLFPEIEICDQILLRKPRVFVWGYEGYFRIPGLFFDSLKRRWKEGGTLCDPYYHKSQSEYGSPSPRWAQKLAVSLGLIQTWKAPYEALYDGWQKVALACGFKKEKAAELGLQLAGQWGTIVGRLKASGLFVHRHPPSFPIFFPSGGSFQDFPEEFIVEIKRIVPEVRVVRFEEEKRPADLYCRNLSEATDLISRAPFVITNDSVYSHLAQFFAQRHFLICSRSRPGSVCFPSAQNTKIVDLGKGLSCRPCAYYSIQTKRTCPAGFVRCMPLLLGEEKNCRNPLMALTEV